MLAVLRGVLGFPHDFADDDGDVVKVLFDRSRTFIGSDAADEGLDRLQKVFRLILNKDLVMISVDIGLNERRSEL